VDEFAGMLEPDFYADAEVIREAFAASRPFNVIHYASTYKFDFLPLANDEYSQTEFGRRRFVETRSFGGEPDLSVRRGHKCGAILGGFSPLADKVFPLSVGISSENLQGIALLAKEDLLICQSSL
jgi:hypothetical protein